VRFWIFTATALLFFLVSTTAGQNEPPEWQRQVRKYAALQDWTSAMRIVEQQIARSPQDVDLLAWRARILSWSGHVQEAEAEYLNILKISRKDPDIWLGLANVYLREGKMQDALHALDSAVELDPRRADLRAARGRALRAAGENKEARRAFNEALTLDPGSLEARSGLRSFEDETKHELRFGQENDLFDFTGPNHEEEMSLLSRWDRDWGTSLGGDTYQRGGIEAGKFVASVTRHTTNWGALTAGGTVGHDNAVIPKSEAFFDLDRGRKTSEVGLLRGLELVYGQHWYWYQGAHILTLSGSMIVYFPREWTFSVTANGARSGFSGTGVEWRPSGLARIGFPIAQRNDKRLSGNVFFAAGTEDFAQVDQIGRFASQTYGGRLRFQLTARQDVTGYASYQRRTHSRMDTNFGFSYGIHF
jgi:tetratricopeptide (TPR) repeat protein